jgi:hypothetical protein
MSWDDGDWDDGYWDDLLPPDAATVTARRFWLSLPQFIRTADELLEYPLLDYVTLWTDQIDVVQTVVDEIAAGHLTNPTEADAAWLRWLCSAVGITIQPWWTEATIRARLGDTATYYAHGTPNAIEAAVADVYTASGGGAPFVWDDTLVWDDGLVWSGAAEIVRHWRGNIWHVIIRTTTAVTPLTGRQRPDLR